VDAGVDARKRTTPAATRSGSQSLGTTSPTETANAAAEAEWPEGNEVVDGIRARYAARSMRPSQRRTCSARGGRLT
jgi:2-iminoacetate synthase ThiH